MAYEVFLNFCGPDTRRGFTNTLYHALVDAGIHVFIDNKKLPRGETFSSNLLQAIDDSKLYITIFSPSYASHHWCLRELAKMVENISKAEEDENKKVILPIFYNVKPDDVKLKTDLYRDAILKLERTKEDKKKKFRTEEVETWRQALKEVDAIQGWELEKYEGDGDLSKSVVEEVVNKLRTRQRKVSEDLVGMDDRIAYISNLLDTNSCDVQLIGIYGMSGIGKTTLAENIFNQLCPHFGKNCSFLANISEMEKNHDLDKLRQQLLSNISNSGGFHDGGCSEPGIDRIGEIIRSKKVLIVLDDVDKDSQIKELIGVNSLCAGTRILVTTRDKSVLKIRNFKYVIEPYEMKRLSHKYALQLFSRHAFNEKSPPADYNTLSNELVSTAGGLPLAIQAIGASLFNQEDKHIWEEMLQELRHKPHDDVLGKLRITFDALTKAQQNIFLDIACFFINKEYTNPIFVWADCMRSPKFAIDVLTKRCMIKISDDNEFMMHDQFRDLGRVIAEEQNTRLGHRDNTDDIICKLRSTEEKPSVRALYWGDHHITVAAKEIKLFPNLQFLWLIDVNLQGDFGGCLSKLKWLDLGSIGTGDDKPFMPTNLHLENVVVMNTYGYEWTEDAVKSLIKEAMKLKVLIIESCRFTHETPTFSEHSVLEKLTFSCCSSLMEISCSIEKLRHLTYLDFEGCDALEKLPEQIGELKKLQHLSLRNCEGLRELPESILKLESLTKLDVSNPDGPSSNLTRLPGPMSKLSKLQTLDLQCCNKIQELPELPESLTTLKLSSQLLQRIPDVSNLTNLVELLLWDFSDWNDQSNIIQPCNLPCIGRLSKLRKMELCLLNVRATSTEWVSLSLLEDIYLYGLDLQTMQQLPSNLRVLKLQCIQVKQAELDGLPNLEELTLANCEDVVRLSITSSLNKLRYVHVPYCTQLVEVQFHGVLKSMESLHIEGCFALERLVCLPEGDLGCNELQAPELIDRVSLVSSSLKMLRKLRLEYCYELHEIRFVSTLEGLKEFNLFNCKSLKRLGGLSNLKNLNELRIGSCANLQVVEGIDELEHLEKLEIFECKSMERFIDASISKIPKECQIWISACGQLLKSGPRCSSITWECHRKVILNAQTQASDFATETTFLERGDPLLEQVAEHSQQVIATDISKSQLNYAIPHPRVRYMHTPPSISDDELLAMVGGENSVDLITVAQAIHWFDLPKFYSLVNCVLCKPEGVIVVWGYQAIQVSPTFNQILKNFFDSTLPYWNLNVRYVFNQYKTLPFPFESVDLGSEGNPMALDIPMEVSFGGILGILKSWSAVTTAKEQGVELLSEGVVREFERAWGSMKLVRNVVYKAFMLAGKVKK